MAINGALPNSSVLPYAVGTDLTTTRDWRQIADFIKDDDTRAVNKVAVEGDATVLWALRTASGWIESAATAGHRYEPQDLQNLAQLQVIPNAQGGNGVATAYMVGKEFLTNLTCDLAFWILCKRRKAGVRPELVSGAMEALNMLDQLRRGERIFPFMETQDAGLPEVVPTEFNVNPAPTVPLSSRANRFFGNRC